MSITAFFVVLAFWSHWLASPPNNPGYVKKELFRSDKATTKNDGDPENSVTKTEDCLKCSTVKVPGVHHCSSCNKCTYMMDHHCPWTNNCVGYLTLKPFLLFLFYVTCVSFFTVGWMYQVAWQRRMHHISFVQMLMPFGHLKDMYMVHFMNPDEKLAYKKRSELDFQEQMKMEEDGFGLKALIHGIRFEEHHALHSYDNMKDCCAFSLTLACGLFTMGLFFQTVYYIYRQTSLVDQAKRKRTNTQIR